MLYPTIFGESLFDDLMDLGFPTMREPMEAERRLYGKNAVRLMKTDVHEHDDRYEVDIDLPGFKKDEITLELEKGYLTVSAAKGLDKDETDKKGKLIRSERYAGAMKRSYYIGEDIGADEIKAKFENGVLKLTIPKKDQRKLPEKTSIAIED